ncbi:MAG: hypothetical protein GXY82_00080 [Methanospirillum sp.]|nr:hypothetical protein [Methanospirillum sp.]
MKSDDEIMAEHLLQGARMLARACPACGCPLFEQKGETTCVVCAARQEEARAGEASSGEAPGAAPAAAPSPASPALPGSLEAELVATLACLLERIRDEPDPQRCRALMRCVRTGWKLLG